MVCFATVNLNGLYIYILAELCFWKQDPANALNIFTGTRLSCPLLGVKPMTILVTRHYWHGSIYKSDALSQPTDRCLMDTNWLLLSHVLKNGVWFYDSGGGDRLMQHWALFRKGERAWRRNWASVLRCDLTQASHFIGVATPLLWVYELAHPSRFWSVCILDVHVHCLPSPSQARVCRGCSMSVPMCVCMWETGYHIVPSKPHLACQGSGHMEYNSRHHRQLQHDRQHFTAWVASAVSCIRVSLGNNRRAPLNSNAAVILGTDLKCACRWVGSAIVNRNICMVRKYWPCCAASGQGPGKNWRSERGVFSFIWSGMMESILGINKPRVSSVPSQSQTPSLLLGLEFLLGHIATAWSWASDLNSLCLGFHIREMGPVIMSPLQVAVRFWEVTEVKPLRWSHAHRSALGKY